MYIYLSRFFHLHLFLAGCSGSENYLHVMRSLFPFLFPKVSEDDESNPGDATMVDCDLHQLQQQARQAILDKCPYAQLRDWVDTDSLVLYTTELQKSFISFFSFHKLQCENFSITSQIIKMFQFQMQCLGARRASRISFLPLFNNTFYSEVSNSTDIRYTNCTLLV